MAKALIIGSGVSGCAAALELARNGHSVCIAESSALIGGKALSYCCKATDECSRCGVCVAHDLFAEALAEKTIRFLTDATIAGVATAGKKTVAEILRANPAINPSACIDCGRCVEACPAACITRHGRGGLAQYEIDRAKCLRARGRQCRKCVEACPASAISGGGTRETSRVVADTALLCTGHQAFDPSAKPRFGYGRLEGVITGEEAEKILSERLWLRKPAEDTAFIQCVGSRDPLTGHDYCSCVCCGYASRMARVLKHRNPAGKVTVYFIDLQNFDKAFPSVRGGMEKDGVEFVRAIPSAIEGTAAGKLALSIEGADGRASRAEHDTVVLSVGMVPHPGATELAALFSIKRDEFGFFRNSAIPGVFITGTCGKPQSIMESIASARAAAADMLAAMPAGRKRAAPARGIPVRVNRDVLVIGAGIAGIATAARLRSLGHKTTLVETTDRPGGAAAEWNPPGISFPELLSGVTLINHAAVLSLSGNVGSFSADVMTGTERRTVKCGAVVVCTGSAGGPVAARFPYPDAVTDVADLRSLFERAKKKDRPRSAAIVLDFDAEETKAEAEMAFREAMAIKTAYGSEVCVLCREVRTAAPGLERAYGDARQAGVSVVKYGGKPRIEVAEERVVISATDCALGEEMKIVCDVAGISRYGLEPAPARRAEFLRGVNTDPSGNLQDNNARFFPELTNRPGIFVAGACRGTRHLPDIETEAAAAALSVHSLLADRFMRVSTGNARVAAEKCALCLTCLRVCPHGAMIVDESARAAKSLPEVCRRCGICVGECPARAITLPEEE